MTDTSLAAPPVAVPRSAFSIWAPGQQLMRHLALGPKAMLLLCAWLPLLLLLALHLSSASTPPQEQVLSGLLDGRFGGDSMSRWVPLGLFAAALLVPLYLTVCVWMAVVEGLDLLRRCAQDLAGGRLDLRVHGFGSDEVGEALRALGAAGEHMARLRDAAAQQAGAAKRSARELADAHLALQLASLEVRASVGEIARRTVALCGMLDSDTQDAERASADLDAIQDEERQALQLMAALRARLMSLAHHCQALGEAAHAAATPPRADAVESIGELTDAAGTEITQCHQLSERVGGAERLNERRIESMRRATDRLVCRAERGMREAQQVMVLTRQIEAAQATTLQRLEQMAASCAALGALDEAPAVALPERPPAPEPAAA